MIKLSKLTVACTVWRGFTGKRRLPSAPRPTREVRFLLWTDATLPVAFFEANEEGVKGGIEVAPTRKVLWS